MDEQTSLRKLKTVDDADMIIPGNNITPGTETARETPVKSTAGSLLDTSMSQIEKYWSMSM